jgi:hypothetical protein
MPLRSDQYIRQDAIQGSFDRWFVPTAGDATGTISGELDIKSMFDGHHWQRLLSLSSKRLSATHTGFATGRNALMVLVRRRSAKSRAVPSNCPGLRRITGTAFCLTPGVGSQPSKCYVGMSQNVQVIQPLCVAELPLAPS